MSNNIKTKIYFKSLLIIVFLLLCFKIQAQEVPPVTVNVATAGTLPSLIASTKKYLITNLTVTGNLNGTDVLYIREMAGSNVYGSDTGGKLSILDLSGANIVAGGSNYYFDYTTSLNKIGSFTFLYCRALTSITIPNSVISIGDYAFRGCRALTSITIPNSVISIGDYAFLECSGIKLLNLGNSLATIGNYAFSGCSRIVSSLIIPSSVKSIGSYAFSSCTGITEIHCKALNVPSAISDTFKEIYTSCKLYIPKGTYANYWLAIGWGDFTNIIEEDGGDTSIFLNINYADSGSAKLVVQLGTIHTFEISPSTGWKINSVMFNGSDVTSQLNAKNQYITPAIAGNSTLSISFESTNTAIIQSQSSNVKVYTEQDAIIVKGADLGDNISVYTESGTLLQTTKVTDNTIRITVPSHNIYLIRTTDKTFKVAL